MVVVGVGAGLSYAGLGATHHSFEDIAIMRVLPNMHIMCPCDAVEVRLCLREAISLNRPVYIRLGKKNEPIIHEHRPDLKVGKAITLKEGSDICLLGCGNILPVVIDAAKKLEALGHSTQVTSMHTVKPLDNEYLQEVFAKYDIVCTVEEHSLIGGFGSAVAEWCIDNAINHGHMIRFGIFDKFVHKSGNQDYARRMNALTSEDIVKRVKNAIDIR